MQQPRRLTGWKRRPESEDRGGWTTNMLAGSVNGAQKRINRLGDGKGVRNVGDGEGSDRRADLFAEKTPLTRPGYSRTILPEMGSNVVILSSSKYITKQLHPGRKLSLIRD